MTQTAVEISYKELVRQYYEGDAEQKSDVLTTLLRELHVERRAQQKESQQRRHGRGHADFDESEFFSKAQGAIFRVLKSQQVDLDKQEHEIKRYLNNAIDLAFQSYAVGTQNREKFRGPHLPYGVKDIEIPAKPAHPKTTLNAADLILEIAKEKCPQRVELIGDILNNGGNCAKHIPGQPRLTSRERQARTRAKGWIKRIVEESPALSSILEGRSTGIDDFQR